MNMRLKKYEIPQNNCKSNSKHVKESGKDTSPNSSSILKHLPDPSKDMDKEYMEFCKDLHITGSEKGSDYEEHKFWGIGM